MIDGKKTLHQKVPGKNYKIKFPGCFSFEVRNLKLIDPVP
jgi:hypothetical protein